MSTLKKSSDGLSRSWEVQSSLKPFYGGSKIDISYDVASNSGLFGCIFNETLSIVDLETLAVKTNVLNESNSDKDSDIEQEGVTCFCLLPNKETVMVAMASTYVLKHMHIGSSGVSVIRTIKGHQMPILAMECDASGSLLATGSSDRIVRVFDIAGGFCTHTFREHTDIISIVRFIPSIVNIIGSRGEGDTSVLVDANNIDLCSASDDKSMMIHNLGTNTQINAFYDHMATPTCISLTPSDAVPHLQFLASSGRDKVINLYAIEAESKKKQPLNKYTFIKTILMKTDELECISFVKMNATTCPIKKKKCVEAILAAGGSCGTLKIICITHYSHTSVEYRLNYEYSLHTMLVQQIHYIPGLDELLVSTSDNNIYFYASVCWDKEEDQECTRELAGNLDDVLDIVVFPDATHEEEDDSSTTEEESDAGAISMAVVTNSKTLRFMDCREGSYLTKQSITIHDDVILAIDCSVDGNYLVTSSKDKTCRVFVKCGQEFVPYGVAVGHTDAVGAVCISQRNATYLSKQSFIISGGVDLVLKRWVLPPMNAGAEIDSEHYLLCSHSVRGHDKDINTLASAPNDSIIASGSQDKKIKLWNAKDLEMITVLSGHKRGIWKLVFSNVDKCLLSSSGDKTMRLWSLQDYSCIRTFQGHTSSVLCGKFVNSGMQILSTSADGMLKLWTIRTGECESTYSTQHTDRIWCVATHPSNKGVIFSGSTDSSICMWKDTTTAAELLALQHSEEQLLVEQAMLNDLKNKKYDKALKAALELNHISKVYGILLKILEEVNSNAVLDMDGRASKECSAASHWDCTKLTSTIPFTNLDSSNASTTNRFEEILVPLLLQEELLLKLLVYIKEWNTNAKYAYVCHMVLDCIISNVSLSDYLNLGSNSTNTTNSIDGYLKPINIQIKNHLEQSLASYVVYSERHYQRISKLNQSSYIIDYICNSMDLLTDFDNLAGGKASVHKDTENGDSIEEELQNDDVSVDDKPSIKKPRLSVF